MSWCRARITLAVHPRFDEEVAVRRTHGAGIVLVQALDGQHCMVPIEWTDLKPEALSAAVHMGQTVHLAPDALLQLAAWVEVRRAEKSSKEVGHFDKCGESRDPDGEQRPSDGVTGSEPRRVVGAARKENRRRPAAAVVEQACSSDARRRRDEQK